jgi:beta-glucosidase
MHRRDFIYLTPLSALNFTTLNNALSQTWKTQLRKADFGDNFKWGVACAAYQVEGAWNIDGKSPSIWDTFSHQKGKIYLNQNADVSCDFYHQYKNDIELLQYLNIKNFRFSISWSRIMPEGIGSINQKGIDFYHRVIDYCLEKNISPWTTLYHWDLPQALENKGGWTNREILNWFSEYTEVCSKAYGDKVKNWMVLNEPMAFTGAGYFLGLHAPGKKGINNFLPAVHHATLCQAEGAKILRKNIPDANIGTTFSCSHIDAKSVTEKHQKAAQRVDALVNRLFIEPALGLGYPINTIPLLQRIEKYYKDGDEQKMKFDFDFIGIQNYTREVVKHWLLNPVLWAKNIPAQNRKVETTEMNWEVYPEGIYYLLKKFAAYKNIPPIYITENGAAFTDTVEVDDYVHDTKREKFIQSYLKQVLDAKNEGVDVRGYFYWSFTDNFEWAEGYRPRFGLVYIDYQTQKRIVKDSGFWFKKFIE